MKPPDCPWCNVPASILTGRRVYPNRPDLAKKKIWVCGKCGARTGCHGDTIKPLGSLANHQTRAARVQAHAAFDPFWKTGHMSRSGAYAELSRALGLPVQECHIGMFDAEQCAQVVAICKFGNFAGIGEM